MSGPAWQATLNTAASSVSTTASYNAKATEISNAIAAAQVAGLNFIIVDVIPPTVAAYIRKLETFTLTVEPLSGKWKLYW